MTVYKSTAIKGIACLMILISHLEQLFEMLGGRTNTLLQLFHPLGFLGVGLFLSVSGYGTAVSCRKKGANWSGGGYLRSRIAKIIPPLFISTLFFACIDICLYGKTYSPIEVFLNAVGIYCNMARFTWYILYQYLWYLAFIVGRKLKRKWTIPYYIGVVLLFLLIGTNCTDVRFQCSMWLMNLLNFPYGIVFANRDKNKHFPKTIWIPAILFLGLFVVNYLILRNPGTPYLFGILRSSIALFFSMAVLRTDILEKKNWVTEILNKVGSLSYEIYLIHGFVIFLFGSLFADIPIVLAFVVILIFTGAASIVLHKAVEKINKVVMK